MNNDYYNSFLECSERVISENKGPGSFCLKNADLPDFVKDNCKVERMKAALNRSIENLDEEL